MEILHAWYAEHDDDLGSLSEFEFMERLTPRRKGGDSEKPSVNSIPLADQYDIPNQGNWRNDGKFRGRLKKDKLYDLCVALPEWCAEINGEGSNGR